MNGHACLLSCGFQLFENSCKGFHHYCQTKSVHSTEHFQQSSSSSVLAGEPLRLDLNFTFFENTILKSLYWENECLRLQLTKLGLSKISEFDNVYRQQIFSRIPLVKNRCLSYFPSDCVSTLNNDIFATKNTQPDNMQAEHWIMFENS